MVSPNAALMQTPLTASIECRDATLFVPDFDAPESMIVELWTLTELIFSSVTRKDLKGVLYLGVRLGRGASGERRIDENSSFKDA